MDERADRLVGLLDEVYDDADDARHDAEDFVREFGGILYIYGNPDEGYVVDDRERRAEHVARIGRS